MAWKISAKKVAKIAQRHFRFWRDVVTCHVGGVCSVAVETGLLGWTMLSEVVEQQWLRRFLRKIAQRRFRFWREPVFKVVEGPCADGGRPGDSAVVVALGGTDRRAGICAERRFPSTGRRAKNRDRLAAACPVFHPRASGTDRRAGICAERRFPSTARPAKNRDSLTAACPVFRPRASGRHRRAGICVERRFSTWEDYLAGLGGGARRRRAAQEPVAMDFRSSDSPRINTDEH